MGQNCCKKKNLVPSRQTIEQLVKESYQEISHGPWSGNATSHGCTMMARADIDEKRQALLDDVGELVTLVFLVSDSSGKTVFVGAVQVGSDVDYVAKCKAEGLNPDTEYQFQVGDRIGRFRTAPALDQSVSLKFGFSSCIGGQGFGREIIKDQATGEEKEIGWPIFQSVLETQSDFFILLGDSIYADDLIDVNGGNFLKGRQMKAGAEKKCDSLQSLYKRYQHHLEEANYAHMLSQVPIYVTWDDHEVMDDWGKLRELAKGDPHQRYTNDAIHAFFTYWPFTNPHLSTHKVYQNFRWGKLAEIFILDTRAYRSIHKNDQDGKTPYMETMLGEEQLDWLKIELAQSHATWKIIVSSVPISWKTGWPNPERDGYDGWSDKGACQELKALLHFIREKKISNLVVLSADVHFPSHISYDPFGDGQAMFHEFGVGPLAALPLGPSPDGPDKALNPTVHFSAGKFAGDLHTFGTVEVSDDAHFTVNIHDKSGQLIHSHTLEPTL